MELIPKLLESHQWKKSMKWGEFDLNWARPLKSIVALFDNKIIDFKFFHIQSSNLTSIEGVNEDIVKKISNFKSYLSILKSKNIILDHEKRKKIVVNKLNSICNSKKL